MKILLLVFVILGLCLTGCSTSEITKGSEMNKQEGNYEINGVKVTEKEYLTFKEQLNISPDFIDERYPGGLGHGATWTATHKKTRDEYRINENTIKNIKSHSISLKSKLETYPGLN